MAKESVKKKLARKFHYNRIFPITKWLLDYKFPEFFIRDVIAGFTIGLMLIPQALAYSELAGLPAYFGLYSSFFAVSVYTLLGTSFHTAIGPTAISAALIAQFLKRPDDWPVPGPDATDGVPELAHVLAFMSGSILFVVGLLDLGSIVNFISGPVLAGFINSAAFTIPLNQLPKIFGVKVKEDFFVMKIYRLCELVFTGHTNWYDFAIGSSSIFVLVLLKELKARYGGHPKLMSSLCGRITDKVLWFTATAKAAIITILMMGVTAIWTTPEEVDRFLEKECIPQFPKNPNDTCTMFTMTMIQDVSLPFPAVPSFGGFFYNYTEINGSTFEYEVTTSAIFSAIGTGFIVVPIVNYLEVISLGKAFAKKEKYTIDPTQEFIALGISNIGNSFFQSFPVSAGMSRSSVNYSANVATQISGWFAAIIVVVATAFLSDLFVYVPSAALGAVIIVSAANLFSWADIKHLWGTKRTDMAPFVVTFIVCLHSSSVGIILGTIVHLCMVLSGHVTPMLGGKVEIEESDEEENENIIEFEGKLLFPSSDTLFTTINAIAAKFSNGEKTVILDFARVPAIDSTAAESICEALSFSKTLHPDFRFELENIKEKQLKMLEHCGLPSNENEMVNKAYEGDGDDSSLSSSGSMKKDESFAEF
ncbi:Oidioi.mRNA.OKI2018_I69.PAR.g9600.t1.cds [Oikopleura dioica]|uniref:Oidioi.mRNA.OKI2018_I69.PAR.g9600.t1.cds n=1 Tax=Oikopleura dioica TaxID=34765 RepID=A0ABN7RLC1_OIKDI|nr:Oidioi.mRNA.OKI2018_I69.PAR.g9600.t1.cds [Oikopleura dioica]